MTIEMKKNVRMDSLASGEGILKDREYDGSDSDEVEDDIDLPIDSPHGTRNY